MPDFPPQIETVANRLKNHNLKVTQQRLEVLKQIYSLPTHQTAEDIYRLVAQNNPHISLSTVYRTLETLVELKELKRVNVNGFLNYYDTRLDPHHHIVCQSCGIVYDLNINFNCIHSCTSPEIRERFHFSGFCVTFFAQCKTCAGQNKLTTPN